MKVKTPAAMSAAAQAAIVLSYRQKRVVRKEITRWLAVHSAAGTNLVDWNCFTAKDMLQWAPDGCSELDPLHGRSVQALRVRTLL